MEVQLWCIRPSRLDFSRPFLGLGISSKRPPACPTSSHSLLRLSCRSNGTGKNKKGSGSGGRGEGRVKIKTKDKENIWSLENDLDEKAAKAAVEERKAEKSSSKGRRRGRRNSRVLVSEGMPMEVETVLQTQVPVVRPLWNTFASSITGIWKGVGAVFSPLTAEIEPIGIGNQNENLYDCYTFSHVRNSHYSAGHPCRIHRKTSWVPFNPFGELHQKSAGCNKRKVKNSELSEKQVQQLPSYESFDLESSEILEEELMHMEPGLVFFEDGSFSRGPISIPIGGTDESKYYLSPTFKFEQCLVKGCHRRMRIVHTIEFADGGSNIQIIRIAVYEEEWDRPADLDDNGRRFSLKSFSARRRTQPSDLSGSWKVFEMNATPVYSEEEDLGRLPAFPCVYLCTEAFKKRSLPENRAGFREEEILDMQDASVLWLPGGVTSYIDVKNDGILCIGTGWYSEEGVNLVMERDYGMDGKLKEVRWKSEVKRRWTDSPLV